MKEDNEELFLRMLDSQGTEAEKEQLKKLLSEDTKFKYTTAQYTKLRTLLHREEPDTLGPFFAERVMNYLRTMRTRIDAEIFVFFKKYQLIIFGLIIMLVVLNTFLSDNQNVESILGIGKQTTEDIFSVDLYNDIISN